MNTNEADITVGSTQAEVDRLYLSKVNELVTAGREELIVEVTEEYGRVRPAA